MATKHGVLTRMALLTLLASAVTLAPAVAGPASPEGAWYGTVTVSLPGATPFPGTDVYTSSSTTPKSAGTVLCTIGTAVGFPVIVDGQLAFMVKQQPTATGSWVRIDRKRVAVTLWRLATDPDTGAGVGSIKNWGIGTMPSKNQLRVEIKSQFYDLDGVPVGMPVQAVVTSERVLPEVEEAAADEMNEPQ
jgi:hypothetical protein